MKRLLIFVILAAALFAVSCGGSGTPATQTVAVNPNQMVYGSEWSPADLNRIGDKMVKSVSKARWFNKAIDANLRWILASEMANDTDEHINTRVIMEKIRTALINKFEVRFVDDQALKDILKQQNLQQSALFNQATVVKVGKISGARLILRGRISNMRNRTGLAEGNMFQITLQVVDIESGDIRWTDEDQIARMTTRSRYR